MCNSLKFKYIQVLTTCSEEHVLQEPGYFRNIAQLSISLAYDQWTTEIKACRHFRGEDIVNQCIAATVYNAGRKVEALDEFGVWASDKLL